jgi:sirohydrochlorin cobaltochelatase
MKEQDTHQAIDDKAAPMASAPMRYREDGEVDWGNMWDSFCVLAREGGPPHRATMLLPEQDSQIEAETYNKVVHEIMRGIREVSGYEAEPAEPGWIAVKCQSSEMVRWLAEAIVMENVQAGQSTRDGKLLLVPAGAHYTLKGEIKNVVTAVAKTTHYWREHLSPDVKTALRAEEGLAEIKRLITGFFRRDKATSRQL